MRRGAVPVCLEAFADARDGPSGLFHDGRAGERHYPGDAAQPRACSSGKLWRELYRELSVNSADFDNVCGKVFENGKLGASSSLGQPGGYGTSSKLFFPPNGLGV